MTASQKHIVADFLRRHRWWYLGGVVVCLAIVGFLYTDDYPANLLFVGVFLGGGASMLSLDLFSSRLGSGSRTFQAAPITAHQLADTLRLLAFVIPAGFSLVFLTVVMLGIRAIGGVFSFETYLITAIAQTGSIGLAFCVLVGSDVSPLDSSLSFGERALGMFHAVLVPGLVIAFSLAQLPLSSLKPERISEVNGVHCSALAFLVFATLVGWRSLGTQIQRPARAHRRDTKKRNAHGKVGGDMPWRGFGGTRYLFWMFEVAGTARTLVYIAALLALMMTVIAKDALSVSDFFSGWMGGAIPAYVAIFSVSKNLQMLRTLRIAPVSLTALATRLSVRPLITITAVALAVHGFLAVAVGVPITLKELGTSVTTGACVLLSVPFVLRFNFARTTICAAVFIAAFAILMGVTKLDWVYQISPYWWTLAMAMALPVVWWFTHRVLQTEHPWKPGRYDNA